MMNTPTIYCLINIFITTSYYQLNSINKSNFVPESIRITTVAISQVIIVFIMNSLYHS